ncbi:cupin domain-containing protein [Maricaulis parjimensis]|uniref:cupin domain-containing protein n=1 Tax=Maricaulis parjimensis TaxID=144023 RepID=UPI00193A52EB|nr:cupin domain-containing protein [Maricaulis parjimensis]
MKKFAAGDVEESNGTSYPPEYAKDVAGRHYRRLGDAAGLEQFGVNLVRLEPGAWSSQRHWHTDEDEFVIIQSGEAVLVTEEGETVMQAGDFAGFPAGVEDGHHLINKSEADCVFLVVGGRSDSDACDYPDIDLKALPGRYSGVGGFTRKDGSHY